MQELSISIDESSDFGPYAPHSPFYLISLVFHDQSIDISPQITKLAERVVEAGFPRKHNIHSAPLIRREKDYALFQAADIACTLTLLEKKQRDGILSKSELGFFHSSCDLRENYLKPFAKNVWH